VTFFVDTSFFFALASAKDPDHERVREVFEEFDPKRLPDLWLTTNHVVMETVRLTKRRISHKAAVAMGHRLYGEKLARIHWTTPQEEREAFGYLARHADKR
jgi:predicted nucleic acid-binding protein